MLVIDQLLVLEPSLRLAWNIEKINGPSGGDSVEATAATEAVSSQFFWSYLKMVQILAGLTNEMLTWAQSCPCHSKQGRARLGRTCPNAGRWMPQLAAGYLDEFAQRLLTLSYGQVLARTTDLSPANSHAILQDFEHARQHLVAHCRIKGAVHRDLPLILSGLAHPCPLKSRQTARRALDLWRSLSVAQQEQAHSLSRSVFCSALVLAQLHAFLENFETSLEQYPELLSLVYRIALARVDEHEMDRQARSIKIRH